MFDIFYKYFNKLKPQRLFFLDAVRAFAILMMLQGHFIDTLLDPVYKSHEYLAFAVWSYFRGITAPLFFTITGIVFTYLAIKCEPEKQNERLLKGIQRGLLLIVIGYALRAQPFSWIKGYFNSYFWVVDVLQCIGVSLIFLVFLIKTTRKNIWLFAVLICSVTFVVFLTEPWYRTIEIPQLPLFLENYFSKSNGSVFTIIPWIGYVTFGAFIGQIILLFNRKVHFKRWFTFILMTSGIVLIYFSSSILRFIALQSGITLFEQVANYNYLFIRLGDVLIIFTIFYLLERYFKNSLIIDIGTKTLSIYVIHFIVLYGSFTGIGLKTFYNKSLSPFEAIIGAIIFLVVVSLIAIFRTRSNAFLYKYFKKIIAFVKEKVVTLLDS